VIDFASIQGLHADFKTTRIIVFLNWILVPGKPSALFLRQKLLVLGVKLPKKIGHLAFQVYRYPGAQGPQGLMKPRSCPWSWTSSLSAWLLESSGTIAWCGNENWPDLTTGRWSASENRLNLRVKQRIRQVSNAEERFVFFCTLATKRRCASHCGLVKIGNKYLTTDGRPCRRQHAGALHMLSAFGHSLWLA